MSGSAAGVAAVTVAIFMTVQSGPLSPDPVPPATKTQPSPPRVHLTGVERWQTSIDPYIRMLLRTAHAEPNYAGAQYLNGSHGFLVKGVGQPSAAVRAAMNQAPALVSVSWRSVPFTDDELDQATSAAVNYPLAVESDVREPNLDGIVVKVHLDGETTRDEARAAVEARIHNGVPVTVIFGPSDVVAQ